MKKSIIWLVLSIAAVIAASSACGEPTPMSVEQVVAIASPYTVFIETELPGDREASGTGIIFDEDGYIVTNAHVVEGAAIIQVHIPNRSGTLSAQLVGLSPCDDLAVIKVPGSGFPTARFGDSNDVVQGEEVIVVGYPLGESDLSVTRGIVSKMHVTLDQLQDLIQTDASTNPGNSGGPLLNMKGEVVGIIAVKAQYDENLNPIEGIAYAISSNIADEKVPRLAQGENIDWIGLNVIPLQDIDSTTTLEGLLIIGVSDGSLAEQAGLQPLDLLLSLEDVNVNSVADLCNVIRSRSPDDTKLSFDVIPWEEDGPEQIPPTGLALVFEDDFSDPTSGWSESITEFSEKGYENGKYSILVNDTDSISWSTPDLSLDDFVLEVDASQIDGPDDNEYGVFFRYVDSDNFYEFAIAGDGYYAIIKYQDGEFEYLEKWTPTSLINRGQQTNSLKVMAEGSQFSFYVNGEHLTDVIDTSFSKGDIGLAAGTFDEVGVLVHFDNVKVWAEEGETSLVTLTPELALDIAFEDDFSGPTCRWDEASGENVEMGCQQNRYRFKVNRAGYTYISLPTNCLECESLKDFALDVKVEQVEGSDQSLYGVVFRYQDEQHYYLFVIRSDGYYTILKNDDGLEHLVDWNKIEYVDLETGENYLTVMLVGDIISVYINGELIDLVFDDSFPTGGIGLAVGTVQDESSMPVIYFDDVTVLIP